MHGMAEKLHVGQLVVGILPEAYNMRFAGKIIKISEEAEFTPKNVQTHVEQARGRRTVCQGFHGNCNACTNIRVFCYFGCDRAIKCAKTGHCIG